MPMDGMGSSGSHNYILGATRGTLVASEGRKVGTVPMAIPMAAAGATIIKAWSHFRYIRHGSRLE